MCGCSGRTGGSLASPGWPWRMTRPDGSIDSYQIREQAEYAAQITGGKVEWVGDGPEPKKDA